MKQKTKKSLVKKIRLTKSGKVMRKHTKQNHSNSKERGSFTRKKRLDQRLAKGDERNVIKAMVNA